VSTPRIKFAIVREDPVIEATLIARKGLKAPLIVASGGCTLLELAAEFPELELTGYDFNPAQLDLVRRKQRAVAAGDLRALNVDDASAEGLNQRGDFEGLFRVWRTVFHEFVATPEEAEAFFAEEDEAVRTAILEAWRENPYWWLSFELAMHHPLLNTMFGPEATQHAEPGSYPGYFERVFSEGLGRAEAHRNPFLQHLLLGRYLPRDALQYVWARRELPMTLIEGGLLEVPDVERFDLVHLSNIFDWSDDALVGAWAERSRTLKPGAVILIRQLNNERNLREAFEPEFVFDGELGAELLAMDRSLFYNRIEVGVRR